jgi:cytochrome c
MDAINEFLVPTTFKYLHLVSYLVYFMLLLHLPYMGMVLGSSVLSLAYSKGGWHPQPIHGQPDAVLSEVSSQKSAEKTKFHKVLVKGKPGLSKDFMRLAMGRPRIWFTFGLLPLASLAFLYKMLLHNTPVHIHLYLLRLLGILAMGFILLTFYPIGMKWCEKKSIKAETIPILAGAGGVLLVLFYCFHFVNLMALLIFPEKWAFIKEPIPFPLFSITPLIHFGGFLCLSLIITGAAVLFFYYKWPEKRLPEDTPHYSFLKYHGYGLLLAGSLLMPIVIFWDLYTLPGYSLSIGVFVISALIIITLFLVLAAAVVMIKNYNIPIPRFSVISFLLALLLFGLVIGKDRTLQANASQETFAVLASDAQKARNEIVAQREELYSQAMKIDEKLGEKIYNDVCTACHSFDQKILGPPFNDVLPKYIDKQDDLIAFIKNPTKIDPQYTAMPNPGLTTIQTKSVVKFLMIKMGVETQEQGQPQEKGE